MPNHHQLATFCRDAYQQKTFESAGVQVTHHRGTPENSYDLFVITGTDLLEAEHFFSRRGWVDVLRDLAIWPHNGGHFGFVNGWERIQSYVLRNMRPGVPVTLIGHSMGGAIAIAGHASLLELSGDIMPSIQCVTFGAPRALILDQLPLYMSLQMKWSSTHYAHVSDPVPGFLKWSRYDHISQTFLGGDKRAPWYKRDFSTHNIERYMSAVPQFK